jgi:hypothetical protein
MLAAHVPANLAPLEPVDASGIRRPQLYTVAVAKAKDRPAELRALMASFILASFILDCMAI